MKFLVVGSPVAHSLSPAMMAAAFSSRGMSAQYEAREISSERWPRAMREIFREGIAGANVTVPHKEAALDGAVAAGETASEIGAANTLVRVESGWRAENTDGPGFLRWLEELRCRELCRREALVLGAGGSARAIVWALLAAGCPRVRIANRTPARAEALRRGHESRLVVATREEPAPEGGLVVNCTSLGLSPDDPAPMDVALLEPAAQILDLVYPDTRWIESARARGLTAESGLGLLVSQGALSFELWTGAEPDQDAMLAAARAELERRGGS